MDWLVIAIAVLAFVAGFCFALALSAHVGLRFFGKKK